MVRGLGLMVLDSGFRNWGLGFRAHRLLDHSTPGSRVVKKKLRVCLLAVLGAALVVEECQIHTRLDLRMGRGSSVEAPHPEWDHTMALWTGPMQASRGRVGGRG